ncbi:MAG TPA: glycosyltransferase [Bacteroidales bacterium]|nr:glycosyltransferase [Bacteroidales bacterium]
MTSAGFFLILFPVVAGLYLFFHVVVIWGLIRLRKPVSEGKNILTHATIILPVRNEEKNMEACLAGLVENENPGQPEIIVADDHSSDRTAEIVRKFIGLHPTLPVRLLLPADHSPVGGSKKEAIAWAMKFATGELILTTDADTGRGSKWARKILEFYEEKNPRMILGPVAFTGEDTFFSVLQSLEFMGLMGVTAGACRAGLPVLCNGANLAYEKQAFYETGGFSGNEATVSGDDMFLMIKIRKRYGASSIQFLLSHDAVVTTGPASGFREFLHQRIRWASKSRKYRDPLVTSVALITWLLSFFLIAGCAAGIFNAVVLKISLLILTVKILVEFYPVAFMAGFFHKSRMLWLYPVAAFLNIFYTVGIGIASLWAPFQWKGRKISAVC